MSAQPVGFFIAPFSIDGELEGLDFWAGEQLSMKWLDICDQFLGQHGAVFDASWSGSLSHIQTRFTSASGAALVAFKAGGKPVASLALVSGGASDTEVLRMFVDSLRQVELVRLAQVSTAPFQGVFSIEKRPLMIVVPWPDESVAEQDHSCVQELALHLAGAFFGKRSGFLDS
jgi:hypothetical protein